MEEAFVIDPTLASGTFEFKRNWARGVTWEDEPVFAKITFVSRTRDGLIRMVDEYAFAIAKSQKLEVRWNFEGMPQGHYVLPDLER